MVINGFPILALELDSAGRIADCSEYLLQRTGWTRQALIGEAAHRIIDSATEQAIYRDIHASIRARSSTLRSINFTLAGGGVVRTSGALSALATEREGAWQLVAVERSNADEPAAAQDRDLPDFIATTNEPIWCIEFTELVDLTQNETEIIRQVFVNECRWTMCNVAMARFYNIPPHLDMRDMPVAAIFSRNPTNEAFVRTLIRNGFSVDRQLSIDINHDGTTKYVENSVHPVIQDNFLVRMWGTVHDITDFKEKQQQLVHAEAVVRNVLSSLPDAVLVANRQRLIKAINPAAERLFGLSADQLLDHDFSTMLPFARTELSRRWANGDSHRWLSDITHSSGIVSPCDVRVAPLVSEQEGQFVLSIRPVAAKHRGRQLEAVTKNRGNAK